MFGNKYFGIVLFVSILLRYVSIAMGMVYLFDVIQQDPLSLNNMEIF